MSRTSGPNESKRICCCLHLTRHPKDILWALNWWCKFIKWKFLVPIAADSSPGQKAFDFQDKLQIFALRRKKIEFPKTSTEIASTRNCLILQHFNGNSRHIESTHKPSHKYEVFLANVNCSSISLDALAAIKLEYSLVALTSSYSSQNTSQVIRSHNKTSRRAYVSLSIRTYSFLVCFRFCIISFIQTTYSYRFSLLT